jgi:sugar lactone lactonase YvrE
MTQPGPTGCQPAAMTRRLRLLVLIGLAACGNSAVAPDPPDPPTPLEVTGLWTASGTPGAVLRLSARELGRSGDQLAATTITTTSAPLRSLAAVAFDHRGDLWVASADDNLLLRFPAGALAESGAQPAAGVIASNAGSLDQPLGIAFDGGGRLWVANQGNGTLAAYDPVQLAIGGAPFPAVVVSGAGNPTGLAFDARGGLWVSDNVSQTISRYAPAALARSGSPRAEVVLTQTSIPLPLPLGLAFDAEGSLWIANLGTRSVVAFGPAELAAGGSQTPRVMLSPASGGLGLPVGLAFDGEGDVWVVGTTGTLSEYRRGALVTGGALEPAVRVTVTGHSILWGAAFWPKPAGLPLN